MEHASGDRGGLGVPAVQVHPVPVNRVAANGQGVDAGQHRPGEQVERVLDVPTQWQVGEAGPLPAGAPPRVGELMGRGLADVQHVEVGGVAEPEAALVSGPVDLGEPVADAVVQQLRPGQVAQGAGVEPEAVAIRGQRPDALGLLDAAGDGGLGQGLGEPVQLDIGQLNWLGGQPPRLGQDGGAGDAVGLRVQLGGEVAEPGAVRVQLTPHELPVLLALVQCAGLADLAGLGDGVRGVVGQDAQPFRRDVQLRRDGPQLGQARHELALLDLRHPGLRGVEQVSGFLLGEVVVLPVPADHLAGIGAIGRSGDRLGQM